MALKKGTEGKVIRFMEFDEARVYIENMKGHPENFVLSAIDYMVDHKEYYFLFKNLYAQFGDSGGEEYIEYLFSRMKRCCERSQDTLLLKKMLLSLNEYLSFRVFIYIVDCCGYDLNDMLKNVKIGRRHLEYLLKHGECGYVRSFMRQIAQESEKNIETVCEFFRIYSENFEPKDNPCYDRGN